VLWVKKLPSPNGEGARGEVIFFSLNNLNPMKISAFKQQLANLSTLDVLQSNGEKVPAHFHITEAGLTTKHFIDCGGTIRTQKSISLQMWVADDVAHRLSPQKLVTIIEKAQPLFGNEDLDVEVEYQTETISRFDVEFNGSAFVLQSKQTDCLAKDNCGVPQEKPKIKLSALQNACCEPNSGCC